MQLNFPLRRSSRRSTFLAAPTSTARLHTLTLSDLHRRLVVDGRVAHALLDLACHGQEGLLDVAGVLGGGLEEGDAEAVREFLYNISANNQTFSFL